jgi:hypothetical protein
VAAVFWEWRYKVLTFFSTGLAGLGGVTAWLMKNGHARNAFVAPLIASAFAVAACVFDQNMRDILHITYDVGKALEEKITSIQDVQLVGVFASIHSDNRARNISEQQKRGYSRIFTVYYRAAAVLFLVIAAVAWCNPHR